MKIRIIILIIATVSLSGCGSMYREHLRNSQATDYLNKAYKICDETSAGIKSYQPNEALIQGVRKNFDTYKSLLHSAKLYNADVIGNRQDKKKARHCSEMFTKFIYKNPTEAEKAAEAEKAEERKIDEEKQTKIRSIMRLAKKEGYSGVDFFGVSHFIDDALNARTKNERGILIKFNPAYDNYFIMEQLLDRYVIFRHKDMNIPVPPMERLDHHLSGIILMLPRKKHIQYITSETLLRALDGESYLVYKGTVGLVTVLGVHVTGMMFEPVSLKRQ